MKLTATTLLGLFLASQSVAGAKNLRQSSRNLQKWHSNDYYWTLSALELYFGGECDIEGTTASCSIPGFSATLTGAATSQVVGALPEAQELKVCQLQSGGNTQCTTYEYGGSMNANQIIFAAMPSLDKFATLSYREALYDMLITYDSQCDLTANSKKTVTSCSMPGSQATLIGTGTGPSVESLQICSLGAGSTDCKTYSFNSRTDTRTILAEAFPRLS